MTAPAQRIDKWLWHARFARSRSAAQRLVLDGKVRLNRDKVDLSSRLVRVDDVLTLTLLRDVVVVRVRGIAERRGPAEEAQRLYESVGGVSSPSSATRPE